MASMLVGHLDAHSSWGGLQVQGLRDDGIRAAVHGPGAGHRGDAQAGRHCGHRLGWIYNR